MLTGERDYLSSVAELLGAFLGVVLFAGVLGIAALPLWIPNIPEPLALLWAFGVGVVVMQLNNRIWGVEMGKDAE